MFGQFAAGNQIALAVIDGDIAQSFLRHLSGGLALGPLHFPVRSVAEKQAVEYVGEKQQANGEVKSLHPRVLLLAHCKAEKVDPLFFLREPLHGDLSGVIGHGPILI